MAALLAWSVNSAFDSSSPSAQVHNWSQLEAVFLILVTVIIFACTCM